MKNDPPATKTQMERLTSLGVRLPPGLRSIPQHAAARLIQEAEERSGPTHHAGHSGKIKEAIGRDTVKLVCAVTALIAMVLTVVFVRLHRVHPANSAPIASIIPDDPLVAGEPAPSSPPNPPAAVPAASLPAPPSSPVELASALPSSKPSSFSPPPQPSSPQPAVAAATPIVPAPSQGAVQQPAPAIVSRTTRPPATAAPAVAAPPAARPPSPLAHQPSPVREPMQVRPVTLTSPGLTVNGGLTPRKLSASSELLLSPDGGTKAGGISARLEAKSVLNSNGSPSNSRYGDEVSWEARITTLTAQPFAAELHWFVIGKSSGRGSVHRRVLRSGSVPVDVKAALLTSTRLESGLVPPLAGWELDGWAMGLSTPDGRLLSTSTNQPAALQWLQEQPAWTATFAKPR